MVWLLLSSYCYLVWTLSWVWLSFCPTTWRRISFHFIFHDTFCIHEIRFMFQLAYTNENLFEFNLHVCLKLNMLQKLQLMLILTLIITDTFSLLSLFSEYLHPMLSLKQNRWNFSKYRELYIWNILNEF